MEQGTCRIGLKGNAKSRSRFGFVVGKEIEVSWELTNLDTKRYDGGILKVIMAAPNGQFIIFSYNVPPLNPNQPKMIDKNPNGMPLTANVLAEGFSLFTANLQNATLESPPGRSINGTSFFSLFGMTMEETYTKWALIAAIIGLLGTFITNTLQLLWQTKVLQSI